MPNISVMQLGDKYMVSHIMGANKEEIIKKAKADKNWDETAIQIIDRWRAWTHSGSYTIGHLEKNNTLIPIVLVLTD